MTNVSLKGIGSEHEGIKSVHDTRVVLKFAK